MPKHSRSAIIWQMGKILGDSEIIQIDESFFSNLFKEKGNIREGVSV